MEHLKDLSNDELEAKLKERETRLKTIIDFVKDIVPKRGVVIRRYQGSCHTKVEWELKNFGGFCLFYSTGLSMMGGDSIKIMDYDHPNSRSNHLCLSIYWQSDYWQSDSDPPRVDVYDDSYPWQEKLRKVMSNKEELISLMDKEAEVEKQRQTTDQKEAARRAELLRMAERLKL